MKWVELPRRDILVLVRDNKVCLENALVAIYKNRSIALVFPCMSKDGRAKWEDVEDMEEAKNFYLGLARSLGHE